MNQTTDVPRPYRRSEHRIRFATRDAQRGWTDLVATARNAAVDAWEFLATSPTDQNDRCYPLKGDLGLVTVDGHRTCDGSTSRLLADVSGTPWSRHRRDHGNRASSGSNV